MVTRIALIVIILVSAMVLGGLVLSSWVNEENDNPGPGISVDVDTHKKRKAPAKAPTTRKR